MLDHSINVADCLQSSYEAHYTVFIKAEHQHLLIRCYIYIYINEYIDNISK